MPCSITPQIFSPRARSSARTESMPFLSMVRSACAETFSLIQRFSLATQKRRSCRFGRKRRRVLLFACETLLPVCTPLPVTWHTRDITHLDWCWVLSLARRASATLQEVPWDRGTRSEPRIMPAGRGPDNPRGGAGACGSVRVPVPVPTPVPDVEVQAVGGREGREQVLDDPHRVLFRRK